jgi:hypothetical protein
LIFSPSTGVLGAVSVTTQPGMAFGNLVPIPRPFVQFELQYEREFDITADGQRFIGVVPAAQSDGGENAAQIQVVLNLVRGAEGARAEQQMTLTPGSRIGPYEILSRRRVSNISRASFASASGSRRNCIAGWHGFIQAWRTPMLKERLIGRRPHSIWDTPISPT